VSEGKEIMLAPLNDGMTREEWLEIGKVLAHLERTGAVQWRIGEWLARVASGAQARSSLKSLA